MWSGLTDEGAATGVVISCPLHPPLLPGWGTPLPPLTTRWLGLHAGGTPLWPLPACKHSSYISQPIMPGCGMMQTRCEPPSPLTLGPLPHPPPHLHPPLTASGSLDAYRLMFDESWFQTSASTALRMMRHVDLLLYPPPSSSQHHSASQTCNWEAEEEDDEEGYSDEDNAEVKTVGGWEGGIKWQGISSDHSQGLSLISPGSN